MKSKELCDLALQFAALPNFYEYGGWGQEMTRATLDALAARYPKNKSINYDNVGKWGFDCICWIKGMLSGVTPQHHINSYQEFKNNCPIGDCTNVEFKNMLYDCCDPDEAPAGYGIANDRHAALSLGNGKWIDCNRTDSGQDGIQVHFGGLNGFKAGKIPSVDYDQEPQTDDVQDFLQFLYKLWKESK